MKFFYCAAYAHPLPVGHRFPMAKYELLPQQLLHEGVLHANDLIAPHPMDPYWITQVHAEAYWLKLKHLQLSKLETRRIGFPVDEAFVVREQIIMQGTYEAAIVALQEGCAMNGAGGTHHAFADFGEGFCMLNDIVLAANQLLIEGKIKKALVVDLDVHQGNGTAKLLQHVPRIFTWSMHCQINFPAKKEQSDLDTPLDAGTGDDAYLSVLEQTLPELLERVRPDIVFYLSGVDVLGTDKLGKLALTREGCKMRDSYVLETCFAKSIPVAISLGGGYSERMADIIEAHANTFRVASALLETV